MRKFDVRQITLCAMVAALYAVLSYFGSIFGLTYGPIQFRFAEALCVLPFLFPATAPGLFVGCLITNLMSTVGPLDVVFGSLATLLAALWTSRMPNRLLGHVRLQRPDGGPGRAGRLLRTGLPSADGIAQNQAPAAAAVQAGLPNSLIRRLSK